MILDQNNYSPGILPAVSQHLPIKQPENDTGFNDAISIDKQVAKELDSDNRLTQTPFTMRLEYRREVRQVQ